jgi:thiol-disulfide isomerase/thioredoxin
MSSGKAVIFDFFASWCVPCEVSTPALNNLYVANGSGQVDLAVIGITIEPTDNDAVVNGLTWGSTYPNLSYSTSAEEFYVHFNDNHGLGEDAIPFFVMVCPNPEDPAYSEIIESYIGADQIVNVFNNTWQASKNECIESLSSAVKEISSIVSMSIAPNPAYDYLNLDISLSEPTDMIAEILDATGKSIFRYPVYTFQTGPNTEKFDVRSLTSGTYFLRLTERRNVNTLRFAVIR